MLITLSIKNFALIDDLKVNFNDGLSIITGETGAGKSILLGGLSLVLGKRADLSSLKDRSSKCIIEAVFDISNYNLKPLFNAEDLDYELQTIIRREILPSGKSRAFVNDTPVNLNSLQLLGAQLIDIHSQHQTLQLVNNDFQFQVIDALAENKINLEKYSAFLVDFKLKQKELQELLSFKADAIKEQDYNSFLLNELVEANLVEGELELLEEEFEVLNNVEEIQEQLSHGHQLLSDEQIGILSNLRELKNSFQKLSSLSNKYKLLYERIHSCFVELDDVLREVESSQENLDADPNRLDVVNAKLQTLHNLFQKHAVSNVPELINIRSQLEGKVAFTENLDEAILEKEAEIRTLTKALDDVAQLIHKNRVAAIPKLIKQLQALLTNLGMPNAQFKIEVSLTTQYLNKGKDELSFLFSANRGGAFNTLKKAASGGELSRIMLAIKSILSRYIKLPTIVFDEIDTGVSGEISNKISDIMLHMSKTMQVLTITHLPQIAAKGHTHFKVYKEDVDNVTTTNLIKLDYDDRIVEIAQMLGGTALTTSAIAHAKELLN